MRPDFSEFSYGFALTEALVDGRQHLVRPTFPTQREERRAGYDVRLDYPGYPLLLQFKLCHGMRRRSAREHKDYRLPLDLPFLRMPLMPARLSPQHAVLLAQERRGHAVFYAAPRFYRDHDFATHYRNRAIPSHSAFIRPNTIGTLPSHLDHHVAFDCNASHGWVLSEPLPVRPILDGNGLREDMHVRLQDESTLSARIQAAILDVTDAVIKAIREHRGRFAALQILRQLCLDVRRAYPNFPETEDILNAPAQIDDRSSAVSTDLFERAHLQFQRELRTAIERTETPARNVSLLSVLARLYCDTTVLLVARPNDET